MWAAARWRSFFSGRLITQGRIPGSIIALFAGTLAVIALKLPVDTIGSKFGGIPIGLPLFHIPMFRADLIIPLLPSALTVALLAAVESLLSAVVADSMTGDRHNSNVELIAQGVANPGDSAVRRHLPATGAIARTATNAFVPGAKSPVAGIVFTRCHVPAGMLGGSGPAGEIYSAGHFGGGPFCRSLQHGRLAGSRHDSEIEPRRSVGGYRAATFAPLPGSWRT